ncbi:DUF3558 domain-containing protein [Saccharopolyspora sp. K220]|uniref:DUF3558 domain-containing protein n=1 Tax=Saccharopolyspora soli TaxID=2926618 RepID=UPI001F5767E3|nr:DUF3558 domain-containing protein [Saccharopolyspora soli]MCI2421698.1 DUF3558 domain-containing protein [Saccharopolyspora soli]
MAGCTSSSGGGEGTPPATDSPAGATPSPASAGVGLPAHGAPKVENPLDTTAFHRNPCGLLTPDQLRQLGFDAPGVQKESGGTPPPSCRWDEGPAGPALEVQFVLLNDAGLSTTYERRDQFAFWQEVPPIDGYPAVVLDARGDPRFAYGSCPLYVGVTDQLEFSIFGSVFGDQRGKVDPCELTRQAAALMLQTMKS